MSDNDFSSFTVMLARQRSGTNALEAVLESHPSIFCTREVLHPSPEAHAHLDPNLNYFRFLERYPAPTLAWARGSDASQEKLLLEYLRFLRGSTDKPRIILDIKYNAAHHFDGPWRSLVAEPHLLRLIRQHGLGVLHLTRRNYLRYAISLQKAIRTRQWVTPQDASPPARDDGGDAVTLPADTLLDVLRGCRAEDDLVARSFRRDGRYLCLE